MQRFFTAIILSAALLVGSSSTAAPLKTIRTPLHCVTNVNIQSGGLIVSGDVQVVNGYYYGNGSFLSGVGTGQVKSVTYAGTNFSTNVWMMGDYIVPVGTGLSFRAYDGPVAVSNDVAYRTRTNTFTSANRMISTLQLDGAVTMGTGTSTDLIRDGQLNIYGEQTDDPILIYGGKGSGAGDIGSLLKMTTDAFAGSTLPNGNTVATYLWIESQGANERALVFMYGASPGFGTISSYMDHLGNWVYSNDVDVVGILDVGSTLTMKGSAGTNMNMNHFLIGGTNYMALWMDGASTTNLYPVNL